MENSSSMEYGLEIHKLYDFFSLRYPSAEHQPTTNELQQYNMYQVSYTLCFYWTVNTDYIHHNQNNAWMYTAIWRYIYVHCTIAYSRIKKIVNFLHRSQ